MTNNSADHMNIKFIPFHKCKGCEITKNFSFYSEPL